MQAQPRTSGWARGPPHHSPKETGKGVCLRSGARRGKTRALRLSDWRRGRCASDLSGSA
jgi:hypothetical protein